MVYVPVVEVAVALVNVSVAVVELTVATVFGIFSVLDVCR